MKPDSNLVSKAEEDLVNYLFTLGVTKETIENFDNDKKLLDTLIRIGQLASFIKLHKK